MLTDDDLAAWVAGLDDLFALVAGRFGRVEPRRRQVVPNEVLGFAPAVFARPR